MTELLNGVLIFSSSLGFCITSPEMTFHPHSIKLFPGASVLRTRSNSVLVFLILVLTTFAGAQSSLSGAISGSAWDGHHAAVAGAQVVLQNNDTGESFEARTTRDGTFRFLDLKPGSYSINAASDGFHNFEIERVAVEVGRISEVKIDFAVAGNPEVVEVREESPAINTSTPDFASNINDSAIDNLPINGRRWSNFALLTPGATLDGNFGLISFLRCNLPNELANSSR
jgi:hypothetical protein